MSQSNPMTLWELAVRLRKCRCSAVLAWDGEAAAKLRAPGGKGPASVELAWTRAFRPRTVDEEREVELALCHMGDTEYPQDDELGLERPSIVIDTPELSLNKMGASNYREMLRIKRAKQLLTEYLPGVVIEALLSWQYSVEVYRGNDNVVLSYGELKNIKVVDFVNNSLASPSRVYDTVVISEKKPKGEKGSGRKGAPKWNDTVTLLEKLIANGELNRDTLKKLPFKGWDKKYALTLDEGMRPDDSLYYEARKHVLSKLDAQ